MANAPVDSRTLLQKPADEIKRPPVLPAGTYHGIVKSYEFKKSKEKQTPYVEVILGLQAPGDGIDPETVIGIDFSKKQLRKSYFLTEDAIYRLKEFLESCGHPTTSRTLGEVIPEMVNSPVLIEVTQRNSQDGSEIFNDAGNVKGAA